MSCVSSQTQEQRVEDGNKRLEREVIPFRRQV